MVWLICTCYPFLLVRVPMYSEAKLFFYIYLWYPKTKVRFCWNLSTLDVSYLPRSCTLLVISFSQSSQGTSYVYDSFFRPYIAKHETDIDRNLIELRTRAGDYAILYWQRAASYGQTRVLDILQYIASQSTPRPRSTQACIYQKVVMFQY